MKEREWVHELIPELQQRVSALDSSLVVEDGYKLPYASEVRRYSSKGPAQRNALSYETDILVSERDGEGSWVPRVVIETKLKSVTTHDAITYSQKAATHKNVHPYLRYGILLAARKHHPLPGRLFRHGANFDFMISWRTLEPLNDEWESLLYVLSAEVKSFTLFGRNDFQQSE